MKGIPKTKCGFIYLKWLYCSKQFWLETFTAKFSGIFDFFLLNR